MTANFSICKAAAVLELVWDITLHSESWVLNPVRDKPMS